MKLIFIAGLLVGMILLSVAFSFAFEAKTPLTDSITIDDSLKVLYDVTDPDEDLHFWAIINRLNMQAQKGDYLYGIRYDVESYFEKEEYAVKYWLEKAFFQVDKRYWDLRVGDFYSSLGRGLVLAVLKNDQFGEDETIQGVVGNFKYEYLNIRGLGGWVNESDSLDFEPERAKKDEPDYEDRDKLAGGGLIVGHPSYIMVGGNYIIGELPFDPDSEFAEFEEDDSVQLISGSIEAPDFIYGNFYGEYAWLEFVDNFTEDSGLEDDEYEGRAAYATATFFFGPVSLIGEYQDYYRFEFAHNEPPNLEYEKTAFSHAPRRDDIIGYRTRVDLAVPNTELLIFGAYYNSQTHEAEKAPETLADHYSGDGYMKWIEHGYGGFEQTFSNAAFVFGSGGYRDIPEGRWIHGELDGGYPVASRHQLSAALHLKGFHSFEDTDINYSSQWYSLEYAFAPYLILTGIYEKSDEPVSGGVGGDRVEDPNFYAGQITVEPHESVRIVMFYGREKGGLQCAGGICRVVPPFEGGRLDLQVRF